MKRILLVAFILLSLGTWLYASPETEGIAYGINTVWVLIAAFLVFLMQAGFGMLEAGFIRTKNVGNVLMKNVLDFCMASLGFFIFGYALMFGSGNAIFGSEGWLLSGVEVEGLPVYAHWFFQAVFCGTAATIVSGGVAGRMKFPAYLIYSFVLSAFIYPVQGHWIWGSGGWLADLGFADFAGSTVVHAVGGWSALVGAIMLGPRIGRFNPDGSPNFIGGHSMPLATLGMFLLWFGWFGFNPGSQLAASGIENAEAIALITMNTNLSAAAGAVTAMITAWGRFGKPDLALTCNGALAGLVGITAPCAFVSPGAAIYIGIISGIIVVFGVILLDKIRVDDPVGAFPVHGLCGVWGTLAVGFFGRKGLGLAHEGLFYGGGFKMLGIQILGSFAVALYVVFFMFIVFKVIDGIVGLRVTKEEELLGLDIGEHGMESYKGFQIFITE